MKIFVIHQMNARELNYIELYMLYIISYPQVTSSWEVLSVLVKWDCHDSVSGVEGFLYTVTMVNVNVHVQHSLVVPDRSHCFLLKKNIYEQGNTKQTFSRNGEWAIVADTPTANILKDVGKSVEFGRRYFFLSFWN